MSKSSDLKTLVAEHSTDEITLEQEIRDLDLAVDVFAIAMKQKLARKAREGYRGLWRDPANENNLVDMLKEHVTRLDNGEMYQEVDIGNIAMMLFNIAWCRHLEKTWKKN